jgi:hypothetical protein
MTELLRRAVAEIEKLSDIEQNAMRADARAKPIATRLLAEFKSEKNLEARVPGIDQGKFVVPDDFNDPLPDEILKAFDGEI